MDVGDRVRNKLSNSVGIVVRITKNGQIAVMEKISPLVINTHDSDKYLEIVDKKCITLKDERKE